MSKQQNLKILFLGDIVGAPGRRVVIRFLELYKNYFDLIIANAENCAHGFGLTKKNLDELKEAGVEIFSGGNHTFDRKEIFDFIETEPNLLRPANYPINTPGKGFTIVEVKGQRIGIINILGRVFMEPLDSPFQVIDLILDQIKDQCDFIIVDIHAEATAEKLALAHYLDGRVSAIVGSHTHVQTADERILLKGTGYISDMGCCGPYNGVIGMAIKGVLLRMVRQLPSKFEIADGPAQMCGVEITLDLFDQKCLAVKRVKFNEATIETDIHYFDQLYQNESN